MKIVVVIVTYNPKKWLYKCLSSLQRSTVALQTIVVDNKSTDGSPIIIRKDFPEVILIESQENYGFGRGNNIGIQKAFIDDADYVFLLNQDAWVEPKSIANLITAHQKEPQYGVVSPIHLNGMGDALDYQFSKYIAPDRCPNLYSDIYLNSVKKNIYSAQFVNAAGWLISRKCLEIVGGFNPSFFHYGEDDNYIHRVKLHQLMVGVCPQSIIYHDREHTSKNNFFTDEKIVYRRSIILKISNPGESHTFAEEYKKCIILFLKSLALLRTGKIREALWKINVLNSLGRKQIIKNKLESYKSQPSFLNQ
jgi:GT2 family glycosyltransferase